MDWVSIGRGREGRFCELATTPEGLTAKRLVGLPLESKRLGGVVLRYELEVIGDLVVSVHCEIDARREEGDGSARLSDFPSVVCSVP